MKQIYTITLLTLLALSAQSRPVNTVNSWWDNWSNASSWSLGRIPKNGDSVVIPAGKAIVFDVATSFTNLYITVAGNLTVEQTMTLDAQSTVKVLLNGQINRWGASPTTEIITLGGKHKFDQTNTARIDGYAISNSITGTAPAGFSANSSLPVTFSSFYAVKNNSDILLTWSTAQEFNNNNFEIQRSTDGAAWTVIAVVMGVGNSTTTSLYSYTDKNNASATVYYRIRQVDFDNKFEYSTVKVIRSNEAAPITKVYASGSNINIEFNKAVTGNIAVRILNTNGQLVAQQNFQQSQYLISMTAAGKGAGLYVIQVSDSKGWSESTKLFL